jgi:hypothetical protein
MQVVGGRGTLFGGRHARAVLVDDDAAEALHAVRNPEDVSDGNSQFARDGRGRISNLQNMSGSTQHCRAAKHGDDDQGERVKLHSPVRTKARSSGDPSGSGFHGRRLFIVLAR